MSKDHKAEKAIKIVELIIEQSILIAKFEVEIDADKKVSLAFAIKMCQLEIDIILQTPIPKYPKDTPVPENVPELLIK